jgi:3-hydroxybutyryl-CoA dehydrogenase
MKIIGVLGTGVMGIGIAQIAAQTGHDVLFWNRKQDSLDQGLQGVKKGLDRLLKKDRISQADHDETLSRIRGVMSLDELKASDMVIETVPEDCKIKLDLFAKLHGICADDVIFASNTSSLSITQLARGSGRPEHFIGMHFFNPVSAMKLVELVRGLATTDETTERVRALALAMNKIPLEVKDYPGFVVNRIVMPMINEAIFALEQGVADAKTIDECMKLGCNHPMGPLALADLVGLDIVLAILESLHREFGDPRYRPCSVLRKNVEAGWLGSKTGRGFYTY